MKTSLISVLYIVLTAQPLFSQNVVNDSVTKLDDLIVTASKMIRKPDCDVYFVNKQLMDSSTDGLNLLNRLMIPSININEVSGTIKSSGEAVQIRVNGREVPVEQLRSLNPESIKRIEWIDNPGLKYNGANAVLNFIIKNPDSGGSVLARAMPALNCAWGEYNGSLKLNRGKSQFGLSSTFKLTNRIKVHREYNEEFSYEDGSQLRREEFPIGGHTSDTNGSLSFDYSYINPDKTIVWAGISGFKRWDEGSSYFGKLTLSNGGEDIILRDESHTRNIAPRLSAYLEQNLSRNQILAVNVFGTLYQGKSNHIYLENEYISDVLVTDVQTNMEEKNKAWGIETNYIKQFKGGRLSIGGSYYGHYNKGIYIEPDEVIIRQNKNTGYIFAEYLQNFGKLTITAGCGANYINYKIMSSGEGNHQWNARPQFSITYRMNNHHRLRASFNSWQTAPSLNETKIIPQQIDGFQLRVGNQNLKTSNSYRLALRYYLNYDKIACTASIRGFVSPDAIAAIRYWDQGKLVETYENSRGIRTLSFTISPQIEMIKDWLMLSGTLGYKVERMRGSGYLHYNHNWSGDAIIILQHWGWTLIGEYSKSAKNLYGETISWGESMSLISLSYRLRRLEIAAGVYCPFTKYDRGTQCINKYNNNLSHIRLDIAPMPFIQLQYNFQWGRNKSGVRKLIDNEVNAESTSVGTR